MSEKQKKTTNKQTNPEQAQGVRALVRGLFIRGEKNGLYIVISI